MEYDSPPYIVELIIASITKLSIVNVKINQNFLHRVSVVLPDREHNFEALIEYFYNALGGLKIWHWDRAVTCTLLFLNLTSVNGYKKESHLEDNDVLAKS